MNDLPTRRAFNRAGAASLERQIDSALQETKAEQDRAHRAASASRATLKAAQGSITRDQLVAHGCADIGDPVFAPTHPPHVRDLAGWHPVIRLNAKSVTVPGPWGGTRTIRIDRLIEVKS